LPAPSLLFSSDCGTGRPDDDNDEDGGGGGGNPDPAMAANDPVG